MPLKAATPFLVVAAADVLNISVMWTIMRCNELYHAIHVFDAHSGECVGESRRAGAMAVASCVFARVAAAAPVLLS